MRADEAAAETMKSAKLQAMICSPILHEEKLKPKHEIQKKCKLKLYFCQFISTMKGPFRNSLCYANCVDDRHARNIPK